MALVALNVFALAAGSAGFIPLIADAIKAAKGPQYLVSVALGQGLEESHSLGGNVPGVSLWTSRGEAIGGALGSKKILPDASIYEVSISGNRSLGDGKAPAEYISVTNGGDNGICVSYVAVSEPSGTKRVFFGDIGEICNVPWYPSVLPVGDLRPRCIWLDRDGSAGNRFQGMAVHLPSFSTSSEGSLQGLGEQYSRNKDTLCKSGPRWRMYESLRTEDPILYFDPPFTADDFNVDGSDKDISKIINNPGKFTDINLELANAACASSGCPNIKNQIDQNPNTRKRAEGRPAWEREKLIVSGYTEHSAEEVCRSQSSRGPDFISMNEMKYCDMDTRIVWNVCTKRSRSCCFDVSTQQMRWCGHWQQNATRTNIPNKKYNKVARWGEWEEA